MNVLLKLLPSSVSANVEPSTAFTPVNVSVPSVVPVATPATVTAVVVPMGLFSSSTLTLAAAAGIFSRVLPVPKIVSLPPLPGIVEGADGRTDIERAGTP